MEPGSLASKFMRGWVIFVVAAVCAAAVGVGLALHDANRASAPAGVPPQLVAPPVPTTEPYEARPGPGGTTVLTETVDPLVMSVPNSWLSPAADPLTLPAVLNKFAAQVPPLAVLLQAEGTVEMKSGIRLFAYEPVAPSAFVSVISFSSPASKPFTAAGVAELVALVTKKESKIAVSGEQLAVGEVVTLTATVVLHNEPIVVETLVLIAGGRTMEIEMASETNVAGVPPVFGQIAQSLRLS